MVSRNIEYLREHGPATVEELPNVDVSVADRRNGAWRVNPETASKGRPTEDGVAFNLNRNLTSVWYLKDEHTPWQVAAKWVDVNSAALARLDRRRLSFLLGELPGAIEKEARDVLGLH